MKLLTTRWIILRLMISGVKHGCFFFQMHWFLGFFNRLCLVKSWLTQAYSAFQRLFLLLNICPGTKQDLNRMSLGFVKNWGLANIPSFLKSRTGSYQDRSMRTHTETKPEGKWQSHQEALQSLLWVEEKSSSTLHRSVPQRTLSVSGLHLHTTCHHDLPL